MILYSPELDEIMVWENFIFGWEMQAGCYGSSVLKTGYDWVFIGWL